MPPKETPTKLRSVQFLVSHTVIFGNVVDKIINDKYDLTLKENVVMIRQGTRTCLVPLSNVAMMELA